MKRTINYAALLLILTTAAFAVERFSPGKGSVVRIEGTSTMHDWKMEGATINGQLAINEGWHSAPVTATVHVAIPVTSIRSEHSRMDRLMAEALKAKVNPNIEYALTSASLDSGTPESFRLKTNGRLTIAGVTRDIAMDVNGARAADGQYVLNGQAPIRMTDFGVKPPTAMMNTIRTGNDVKVTFRWVVTAAN